MLNCQGRLLSVLKCLQPRFRNVSLLTNKDNYLIDEPVEIKVTALQNPDVTISATVQENSMTFISHGHYVSENGAVVTSQTASVGGSFVGVERMGLFWSMKQAEGQKAGLRLMKKDVTEPYNMKLTVWNGHVNPERALKEEILCETVIKRSYTADGVRRVPVRAGNIRGALFIPPGEGPFPGVVDLFGSGGGLIDHRAALLASRGFATLSLAYFRYEDLPLMFDCDMEYFEEAIDWLNLQPFVSKGNIGMVGISLGGELTLLTASVCPKLRAVVAISTNAYVTFCSHKYKGVEYKNCPYKPELVKYDEDGYFILADALTYKVPEARIKLENIQAPVLILQGSEDLNVFPSAPEDVAAVKKEHGNRDITVVTYEGAGHLIEPPYSPLCYASYHKLMENCVAWGGKTKPHAQAQEHSWKLMLDFLRKNLA